MVGSDIDLDPAAEPAPEPAPAPAPEPTDSGDQGTRISTLHAALEFYRGQTTTCESVVACARVFEAYVKG